MIIDDCHDMMFCFFLHMMSYCIDTSTEVPFPLLMYNFLSWNIAIVINDFSRVEGCVGSV